MSKKATPFDALLGIHRERKPKAVAEAQIVVNGRRVTSASQLKADDEVEALVNADVKRALQRAKEQARYQRDRLNPEAMAKRQAWQDANRDKVRAYKKEWDKKNKKRQRALQKEWARRDYRANPERHRQKQRDYYARNREAILAKLQAQRDAAKAEKTAGKEQSSGKDAGRSTRSVATTKETPNA